MNTLTRAATAAMPIGCRMRLTMMSLLVLADAAICPQEKARLMLIASQYAHHADKIGA